MDWLLEILDLSELTALGRGLLVAVIVEGVVIVHLWRARMEDWRLWREEAERARRELRELAREILASRTRQGE